MLHKPCIRCMQPSSSTLEGGFSSRKNAPSQAFICRQILNHRTENVPNLNHFGTLFPEVFCLTFSRFSLVCCCAGVDTVLSSGWDWFVTVLLSDVVGVSV